MVLLSVQVLNVYLIKNPCSKKQASYAEKRKFIYPKKKLHDLSNYDGQPSMQKTDGRP